MEQYLNEGKPLVSIIVITYNSELFIIETLNSAYAQDYNNIELIISDDYSSDGTIEICKNWLVEHKDRFIRAELITVKQNFGLPSNCNRGVKKSKGKWIKMIAGDDILMEDCISNGVSFINSCQGTSIFASNVVFFSGDYKTGRFKKSELEKNAFFKSPINSGEQFRTIIHENPIIAPAVFFSRSVFDNNNGFNEDIPYMEDYPFWIKILSNGIKIDLLPKVTVAYRLHENSISSFNDDRIFNNFYKKHYNFQIKYTFKYMNAIQRFNHSYVYFMKMLFDKIGMNQKKYTSFFHLLLKLNLLKYFN